MMTHNAVLVSVILSLFILSHARSDRVPAVSDWNLRDDVTFLETEPKFSSKSEIKAEIETEQDATNKDEDLNMKEVKTVTVNLRPIHFTAVNDADRSRMIAHSLRLPIVTGASKPHRHVSLRPKMELSYGNDMVGLPKMKKKGCGDVDSESKNKMMMMKKRLRKLMKKKPKRENRAGFMDWISRILNHF